MKPSRSIPWCIHTIGGLYSPNVRAGMPDGTWPLAIPEPYSGGRLKAAWWVLTGRAYAFLWPDSGDLERALGMPMERPQPPSMGRQAPLRATLESQRNAASDWLR